MAAAVILVVGGFYYYMNSRRTAEASSGGAAEKKSAAAKAGAGANDLSKYVEVAGIRVIEEQRKPVIKFMIVNHSAAEIPSVTGNVVIKVTGKDEVIASVPLNVASLGPYEGKDISAPLKTKLRPYEMPDWQFMRAEAQLDAK